MVQMHCCLRNLDIVVAIVKRYLTIRARSLERNKKLVASDGTSGKNAVSFNAILCIYYQIKKWITFDTYAYVNLTTSQPTDIVGISPNLSLAAANGASVTLKTSPMQALGLDGGGAAVPSEISQSAVNVKNIFDVKKRN